MMRSHTIVLSVFIALISNAWGADPPRIAVVGISHESNSFNPAKTDLESFSVTDARDRSKHEEILSEWARSKTTLSGYVEGARRSRLNLYPVLTANASPRGPVTDRAFNTLLQRILEGLDAAPKLDGLLVANHGAMVVESHPHGDAEMVRRLREKFGSDFPIVVTHDFHANVSPEIVRYSTVLITYKENPHLDTWDRGIQAAGLMSDIVAGRVKPVQRLSKPPMMYNIVHQNTFAPPLLPIVDESKRLEENPKILAVSVSGGYQYADVSAMGPTAIVVTDGDPELAQREADRLAGLLWETRDRLGLDLPDAAEAVKRAIQAPRHPVVLMEMSDNIGGGSSGDATFILEELIRQKASGWVITIADPAAARAAFRSGVGSRFEMPVGGKTDDLHGKPVLIRGRVKSLHDGKYVEPEIRHGGGRYNDLGHSAVVEVEGSTRDLPNLLLLTPGRTSPNSLHQIISVGIYPERQKILVVKGAIAPRAAYEPISAEIIPVDTPGTTAAHPRHFQFKHIRRPLFGVE